MFDDLITDSKIPIKALISNKIEEFEIIIFDIRINFHRKTDVIVADDFHFAKNTKLNFW